VCESPLRTVAGEKKAREGGTCISSSDRELETRLFKKKRVLKK
jgi:hypothetical protein